MIELCAVRYSDFGAAIRHERDAARRRNAGVEPKYFKKIGRGVSLTISGDEPVESLVYDGPDLSLICRADLLLRDAGAQADAAANPALSLARLYACHGDAFVNELRGTFAIILYDYKLRVLKAWTDHFGAQRLVFSNPRGFLTIATDIRALIALCDERPEVDPVAIQQYAQYACIPAPKTVYKGISRLMPGHQLVAAADLTVRSYWDMSYREPSRRTESEWSADTERAIRSAVSLNLGGVDAAQLGCFLSGGTDSSSIAGLASQEGSGPARTFSIGFDDDRYNEIQYARIAAEHNKCIHHEYFVTPDDILALIDKAVPAYDEPFGNSSIIPTYYCARLAAANGVTHLLAGDGGDELFGGNARYVEDRVFQRYNAVPVWMRRLLIEPAVSIGALTRSRLFDLAGRYIRRASIPVPDRFQSYSLLSSFPHAEVFTADFLSVLEGHDPLTPARQHFVAAPARNDLDRWLYLDLKMTITDNDLRKVTVMSQLAGVTARYPLLEPTLAEFTGTIPAGLKVRGSQLRYLFKRSMAGILPPQIITKSKHGFGLPFCVWLGEHTRLRDFAFDVLGSSRCRQRGYFRSDLLDWLWDRYKTEHQRFYGDLIWVFLMLELWHTKQHDSGATAGPELMPALQGTN